MGKLRFLLAAMLLVNSAFAGETKVGGELYPQWYMDFSAGADHFSEFELTRTYVTVTSDLNERTDVRFTADLRSTSGYSGYTVVVKYGYVNWRPEFLKRASFRFGLQQTQYIDIMNKVWGRRYLEKTVSDLSGMLTSADLGASSFIKFGNSGTVVLNLAIFNGTSYSNVNELNKQKDLNAVLFVKPAQQNADFKNSMIVGQIYYGTQNMTFVNPDDASDYRKSIISIGGILDYTDRFSIGLDANWETLGQGTGTSDLDVSAVSLFATYLLGRHVSDGSFLKNCNILGRIDFVDPDGSTSDDKETYSIIGLECVTSSSIRTSLNVRTVSYEAPGVSTESFLFLNAFLKI